MKPQALNSLTLASQHQKKIYGTMTVFVPVKIMTIIILISFIFSLSIKTGFCLKQTGTCRHFCTESYCITLNQDRVDFKTAKDTCHERNGELVTFQLETDESFFDIWNLALHGNFWIGLHLPDGACSNVSTPLRGYQWTSGSNQSFVPSFSTWKDSVQYCSPRCVSLSNDQKWTERLCSDKTDGFLCKSKLKEPCQAKSDPNVFQSYEGCSTAPCEHTCTDVEGGFKCSCYSGYISDSKNPVLCKLYCAHQKCPAVCDRNTGESCSCPDGFIVNDKMCEDIDECLSDQCAQECKNTLGSFVCSCSEGFVLKDQDKCIKVSTPIGIGLVKPAANNDTLKASSAPASGFLWIWIFAAIAVVVFILVIRFYVVKRQKGREQNSSQQSSAPVDKIEC
ncbi:thrombomodulin [Morone saxatilis]|uniref:thrombomodulin n=1 Tax=Morone saxatilis TaxID=34816 RepID=UPI0015E1DEB6|nr:thrombomodulin [Morone saxatilis]